MKAGGNAEAEALAELCEAMKAAAEKAGSWREVDARVNGGRGARSEGCSPPSKPSPISSEAKPRRGADVPIGNEAEAGGLGWGGLGLGLWCVGGLARADEGGAVVLVSQSSFDGLSAVVVALALLVCFWLGFKLGRGVAS